MLDDKRRTEIIQRFGRTYRAFMAGFEKQVRIPMPRWRVMLALMEYKTPQPQKTLKEALGMDAGALTRQLQQLECQSLIQRAVDDRDNRVTNVMLTERGRQAIALALPARDDYIAKTLAGLSEEHLNALDTTLALFEQQILAVAPRKDDEEDAKQEPHFSVSL